MQQWVADVCSILKASGQLRFAEAIDKAIPPEYTDAARQANTRQSGLQTRPVEDEDLGWLKRTLNALRFRILLSNEPLGKKFARVAKRHVQESLARFRSASGPTRKP